MPMYLTRFSYTPEHGQSWSRIRRTGAPPPRKYIESVGGKLHGFWYAFGDHATPRNLWEAPDNVSMAAVRARDRRRWRARARSRRPSC